MHMREVIRKVVELQLQHNVEQGKAHRSMQCVLSMTQAALADDPDNPGRHVQLTCSAWDVIAGSFTQSSSTKQYSLEFRQAHPHAATGQMTGACSAGH